jgi:hypothetical protein
MRYFIFLAAFLFAMPAHAMNGREIIDRVVNQPSPDSAMAVIRMTVSSENTGARQLTSWVKKVDGRPHSVVKFQEPADYRGAGILAIERDNGEVERFIRLQGQRRARRLPAGSQSGSFLNTDFSYEDLDGRRDIEKDRHDLLREETLNGQAVYVVATVPHRDSGSAYKRVVQWVRKDNFVPIKIEFFGDGEQPIKRLEVDELKQIDGFWISTRSRMSTLARGTTTSLEVIKTDFKSEIPNSHFDQRFLLE